MLAICANELNWKVERIDMEEDDDGLPDYKGNPESDSREILIPEDGPERF